MLLLLLAVLVFLGLRVGELTREVRTLKGDVSSVASETSKASAVIQTISQSLNSLNQTLGQVNRVSQELHTDTRRMVERFELLLSSGKEAGTFGEVLLEDLVKDTIPEAYRDFQREVIPGKKLKPDCVIKVGDKWLPIDSKFPVSALQTWDGKGLPQKIKEQIDETSKYILPESGTTNFAFMFIPSEGLFLKLLEEPEFLQYARKRRVYPVSPTTLFAFLDAVRLGIQREEMAKRVEEVVDALNGWHRELKEAVKDVSKAAKQANDSLNNTQKALTLLQKLEARVAEFLKAGEA